MTSGHPDRLDCVGIFGDVRIHGSLVWDQPRRPTRQRDGMLLTALGPLARNNPTTLADFGRGPDDPHE